jgi:hypothetical protein
MWYWKEHCYAVRKCETTLHCQGAVSWGIRKLMDLFLWTSICLEIMSLMLIPLPLPPKEENRTWTLKAELEFQGSVSSFWRIFYIDGRQFLWNVLPPSLLLWSNSNWSNSPCDWYMCVPEILVEYIVMCSCVLVYWSADIFKVWYVCFVEMVRDVCTVVTSWLVSRYIPQERCCSVGWT